ncbi:MAG: hypothetical protein SFX73_21270 [Kofleriaceae bacterium]|nr:hypothetical protein [Kofleriaceae bacterium]
MIRLVLALSLVACGSKSEDAPVGSGSEGGLGGVSLSTGSENRTAATPRGFWNRGVPTFIVGTTGDDASDREIVGQVDLVRAQLLPNVKRIADTEIETTMGAAAWPTNPIVYGGAHVNSAIAAISSDLPFTITAGKITIGDRILEGEGLALITVIPARAGKFPDILLFAGTGTPGVREINSPQVVRVDAPIVIADAFGPLVVGAWKVEGDRVTPQLEKQSRRVDWRETKKTVADVDVAFRFYDKADAAADQPAIDAATRGIETVMRKLGEAKNLSIAVYVHPDQKSKQTLTGNGGAGHAIAFAKTLHVFNMPRADALEALVAHEGTHVITPQMWPSPGSPLFGEGLAVWVAGGYAETPLAELRKTTKGQGTVKELLGPKFRQIREQESYPIGGILVEILVEKVGLANIRDHLYGATAATWDDACKRAGTNAAAIDDALATALAR